MDLKEIDAELERLKLLRTEAVLKEAHKLSLQHYEEACALIPQLVAIIRRLDEINYLPQRIAQVVATEEGKVNPGQYLKKPRAPVMPHG